MVLWKMMMMMMMMVFCLLRVEGKKCGMETGMKTQIVPYFDHN